ncbi:hypothetical protein XELAEV_18006457mg [Xenopus laevis]|uniref:Uncharacterized protein n=1 Tax=Xenopus laevis TaxID=8355 RepID=A0A974E0L0_XENLA|nr:hypothetical protein XELAEV_18006457mg [Xenopus laevis]
MHQTQLSNRSRGEQMSFRWQPILNNTTFSLSLYSGKHVYNMYSSSGATLLLYQWLQLAQTICTSLTSLLKKT